MSKKWNVSIEEWKRRFYGSLIALATLAQAAPAMADHYGRYDNAWTTCETTSQGYTFRNADYGTESARARALNDCTSNRYTVNGECRYKVTCEDDVQGEYARCTTQSQGYTFLEGGVDAQETHAAVIAACEANRYTNNGECRYNSRCEGGGAYQPVPQPPVRPLPPVQPRPPVRPWPHDPYQIRECSTSSAGRVFTARGPDLTTARFKAIESCQRNPYTRKAECSRNSACR